MAETMKALILDATWEPRSNYKATPAELKTHKAISAHEAWKEPKLEISEIPIPAIEEDEVLIKVKACGICGSDTHCYENDDQGYIRFSGSVRLPVILGHEFAGEVVDVGKKVEGLKIKDPVASESMKWCGICTSCRSGYFNQCECLEMVGFSAPGAFAEYIAIKEKYCWKLDALRNIYQSDDQLYEAGALIEPIGCAYNGMFISGGGIHPGAYVVVYGAGPIGLGVIMLARAAGASKIVVFDIKEERNQLALKVGADYALNPNDLKSEGSSESEFVLKITDGHGADMQIEAAGAVSQTFPQMNKSFSPRGKLVFLGREDSRAIVEFDPIVSQASQFVGSRGHSGYGIYPNIIRMMVAGRIQAHDIITSRFPFAQVLEAMKQSSTRSDGKIMIQFP